MLEELDRLKSPEADKREFQRVGQPGRREADRPERWVAETMREDMAPGFGSDTKDMDR